MRLVRPAVVLMLASLSALAWAQSGTSRPVRLVATSSPGSPVDLFARAISDALGRALGQSVVVENRAGAGGTIAAGYVLAAEPDGSTVLVNTSAQVIAPFVFTQLGFDMIRDYVAVAPLGVLPNVLIVPAARPWRGVSDLIAAARARPGALSYGTGGSGTGTHLSAERFRLRAGLEAVQVPYKGSPEALVEVAGGRVDWSVLPLSTVLPHVRDGRVRALALSAERRSRELPDLPTLAEAGLPDADFLFWVAAFVSAKTPAATVRRLRDETVRVLQSAEVRERLARLGAEESAVRADDFDAFVRKQAEIAAALVKAANVKAN